ncbi:MAG: hypothetical protein SFU87_19730 [Chitinophagaceae bacterium]|nr:hypothetical protein [Chitinophagaceae bacterium]
MAGPSFSEELDQLKQYISSDDNEDAKRPLLYPLFKRLFKEKFKIESNAFGADVYCEGQIIVESKTDAAQWLEGFYQALHYQKKHGLAYNTIMVIANRFVGIWKVNKIPEYAIILSHTADASKAPNTIGKENTRKTARVEKQKIIESAFYWLTPKDLDKDAFSGGKSLIHETYEILKILRNLDSDRLQINTHNFINTIERMKIFFDKSIDAVHAFYTIVAYWDITSTLASNDDNGEVRVVGFRGSRLSDPVLIAPKHIKDFRKFIETQYVFTNEGSGLTVDYYFSRFDEVMAKIDEHYVKQHGIFFTDANLSKFALWFAKYHFPGDINENYIVFDPAGGSGNLVSSWRGKLKHKIISELQPDLLRTIERRMKVDPFHVETGFTIIPKTSENKGLNFLDKNAVEYLGELKKELALKNILLDKPIAFLLNPPYKNTDENQKVREEKEADYGIHPSIIELTGEDAGKERYLAFLGQILNIAKEQVNERHELAPVVMIFTPTSWLIPRPTYKPFREHWDRYFHFHSGFIVTSNEFFKLQGAWPLAFTIWNYNCEESGNDNKVELIDLTLLTKPDLNINWNVDDELLNYQLNEILNNTRKVTLDNSKGDIRDWVAQSMYDFKRDPTKEEKESGKIYGGLPEKDERRSNKKTYGLTESVFIGFMDDATPVRVRNKEDDRFKKGNNTIWFRLDAAMKDINKSKCFSGPTDNRSYCAYDLSSAKATCSWFAITKALNGRYPVWANQYDIWTPDIKKKFEQYWYSLCFAFVLAENRCVVTKFEKDNPVKDAPEVFVDNPLCPANKESFWSTTLDKEILQTAVPTAKDTNLAKRLVDKIKELYKTWNLKYCKGQFLTNVGLHEEAYFKYFDYADFLTPYSGLIQIKKYAEQESLEDIQQLFAEVTELSKKVKDEIYRLLVDEFKYFE